MATTQKTKRERGAPPGKRGPKVNGHAEDDPLKAAGEDAEVEDDTRAAEKKAQAAKGLNEWNAGKADYGRIPPRQWLLGTTACIGFISSTIAEGGIGKTALWTARAVAVATGKPITKEHVWRRGAVLYISLEDDDDEMRRRTKAVMIHHRISPEELDGWLYFATPKGMRLMLREDRSEKPELSDLDHALIAAIERIKPVLIILDPFVKSHGLSENDNNDIDIVMARLAEIAQRPEYRCAIEAPHHVAKGGEAGAAKSGRGASSFKDAARISNSLTAMTKAEAGLLGVDDEKLRRSLFRIDSAKVNLTPPNADTVWFKLVGINLGNGDETYPNGDNVQTVEPWYPPDIEAGMDDAARETILDQLEKGLPEERYSCNPTASGREAWKVIKTHCSAIGDDRCKALIKHWRESGILTEGVYTGARSKARKGIVAVKRGF